MGRSLLTLARDWRRRRSVRRLSFGRPLVVLHSDDWGRVGVRDQEGLEQLRAAGLALGERPYDLYTLETAEDVAALQGMLNRHRDASGRSPSLVMNFITANLDFTAMALADYRRITLLPLTKGLPGAWKRQGLFDTFRHGIAEGLFFPALHGLTHFCRPVVERSLSSAERSHLLKTLWKAETPYIHWRMPWIGYEYWDPDSGSLPREAQEEAIGKAAEIFRTLFVGPAVSACAAGYRSNKDTYKTWSDCGVHTVQSGTGSPLPPHLDEFGLLHVSRTVDFEPAFGLKPTEDYLRAAKASFARGEPFIISVHSINFHSTLRDFRGPTLRALDELLTALERQEPELLYVHDGDLFDLVVKGKSENSGGRIPVQLVQQ
jgi:hypothetical protein